MDLNTLTTNEQRENAAMMFITIRDRLHEGLQERVTEASVSNGHLHVSTEYDVRSCGGWETESESYNIPLDVIFENRIALWKKENSR